MGCDGGTIPRRDELVKLKKKKEEKDKQAELLCQWRYCALSQEILEHPIVACGLGRLYNKSAVIEGLLNRSVLSSNANHLRSLRDIKDLNLTPNPEYGSNIAVRENINNLTAPYICPVTGLEMSGKFRFIYLWTCGCVMSERALKEINTNVCPKCQNIFTIKDVIILNGNENDLNTMKQNMEERQALQKVKRKLAITSTSISSTGLEGSITTASSAIKTASKTIISSQHLTSPEDPDIKRIKMEYSVAKDPKATDVYKSLFTTSTEKTKAKAHWITYNPFYN